MAIARRIGEGIAAAQPARGRPLEQLDGLIGTARLKMKNPEPFDGAAATKFGRWWESVVVFLDFYPNTTVRQKIAWVGALLTETALSWHLHRYRDLGDADSWANYSTTIRTEYHDAREAADARSSSDSLNTKGAFGPTSRNSAPLTSTPGQRGRPPRKNQHGYARQYLRYAIQPE
jgi:hypothetical protein